MKITLRGAIVVILLCLIAIPMQAQDNERVYEEGSVWSISYIKTKPGHYDDYIKNLSDTWRNVLDEYKKDGKVLSYKILSVVWARDNEPNLMLMVEYKDWTTFDTPDKYWDDVREKVLGSLDETKQIMVNREDMRTLRGSAGAVELIFK